MGKILKEVLLLGAVAAAISGCVFINPLWEKTADKAGEKTEDQTLSGMTPKEQAVMIDTFGEDESARIKEGRLFSYQEEALSQLREGVSYLENRYPGHDFLCTSLDPANKFRPWAEIYFKEGNSGNFLVKVIAKKVDGHYSGYICEDNFYGQILRKEYNAALEEMFADAGYKVRVYACFINTLGEGFPADASVDDLLKADTSPSTAVYVSGAVPDREFVDGLRAVMEENHVSGDYFIYFTGTDVTSQTAECLEAKKAGYESLVFSISI